MGGIGDRGSERGTQGPCELPPARRHERARLVAERQEEATEPLERLGLGEQRRPGSDGGPELPRTRRFVPRAVVGGRRTKVKVLVGEGTLHHHGRGELRLGEHLVEDAAAAFGHARGILVHGPGADAVFGKCAVDARPAHASAREPQPEVPVLGRSQRLVEATDGEDGLAADDRRMHGKDVAEHEARQGILLDARPAALRERCAAEVDALHARVHEAEIGSVLEGREHGREHLRPEPVVGVEEEHEGPSGSGEPRVACRGQAAIRLAEDACPVRARHRIAAVRRAVIDDDGFDVAPRKRLRKDAVDRFRHERAEVVERDHHADARGARAHGRPITEAPHWLNRSYAR